MKHNHHDVVIVGSGIAGAVLAKTLTNAGKKVLILEAGLQAGMALEGDAAYNTYQDYIQTFYKTNAKVPNSPYPDLKDAPSIDILQIQKLQPGKLPPPGYLVQKGPLPFASDCFRGPGGTTLHWLGTTLRMLPNDFRMKTVYNQNVDWPIDYEHLKRFYEMAELEIGVSGDVQDQNYPSIGPDFWGPDYVFPMKKIPQSYMDKELAKKTNHLKVTSNNVTYDLTCISTPQGRNSIPNKEYPYNEIVWNDGDKKLQLQSAAAYGTIPSLWDNYTGERCEGNASCVPICPVQAKYNALKTLKKATDANLDISTRSVVSKIIINDETQQVESIEYKVYTNPGEPEYTVHHATGTLYVLAASAIENAKILLASDAAKTSDQVGRNLMDHLVMLTWGLSKEKTYPYRGPGSTTNIPTFRDGDFRREHAAWISPIDNWGWSWPVFSPGSDVSTAISNGLFGKALRTHINEVVTRQILLHFEVEQSPEPQNRVTIDPLYKDAIGNYKPVIEYSVGDYMLKSFEAAKLISDQIFAANEIEDHTVYNPVTDPDYVTYKGQGYTFRGAGHIVGTHRMGFTKHDSVVDKEQRCWDHTNLFLVGCGNMPTLGTSNPTLTMTALAFNAAENILKQLETMQKS